MKKIGFWYLGIFVMVVFLSACASHAVICDNNWQDHHVNVDGKAKEWEIPLRFYDADTKFNFTITNDNTNLYYCIRITDDKEEMRALKAGMQFWIDTTGNKAQQVSIQYPFPQMRAKTGEGKGNHSGAKQSDTATMAAARSHFSEYAKQMRLSGFIPPIGGITEMPNEYGINVAIARDSAGVMIYEGCIPFKTFYRPVLTPADKNKIFGITIILNGMPESEHSGGGGHGGGGGGGGMRGMGGGGMGGGGHRGGGGGGGEPDDGSTRPQVLRLKIRLASRLM
jgi:hypothetical protein